MSVNLLDLAHQALRGVAPEELGRHLSESSSKIDAALGIALPVMLGGLVGKSLTLNSAGALLDVIDLPEIDPDFSDKTKGLLSDRAINFVYFAQIGATLLARLFPEKSFGLVNRLASEEGIEIAAADQILSISAVLTLALIKRQVIEHNLGAAGLVDLMQAQGPALLEKIEAKYAIVLGSPSSQALLGLTDIEATVPRRASAEPAAHGLPINTSNKLSLAAKKALPWVLGVSLLLSLIAFLNACDARVAGTAIGADSSAKDSVAKELSAKELSAKELTNKVQRRLPALEKIYFDTGRYETPDDTSRKVRGILEYAKVHGNSRLTITGFHDTLQETEPVQRLARQRSMAVRSVLISAGIAEDRVVMLNAQEPIASVGERQATRVEVSISE